MKCPSCNQEIDTTSCNNEKYIQCPCCCYIFINVDFEDYKEINYIG